MKRNERPDILKRFRNMKLRKELTVLLALFVMISTSYAMIHPGEALNNNVARTFMFFNEEEGMEEENGGLINASELLEEEREAEAVNTEVPAEESSEPAQEETAGAEETSTAVPQEESAIEPTSTPAETVVPTLEPTEPAEETAEPEEAEETSDPLSTASAEAVLEETSTPEATASAEPDATASAEPTETPEVTASPEPSATPEAEEEEEILYPAIDFGEITPLEEDGTETKENIIVTIKAPEGAFPEGTEVKVVLVRDTEILDAIEKAAEEDAKAQEKNVEIKQVQAVDITFYDKDGDEIQPKKKIAVSFKSALVKEADETTVVHVEQNEEKTSVVETKTVETITDAEKTELVEKIDDDEIVIEADSFSVYGFVGTELVTDITLPGSDDIYEVTVTYGRDAEIPENVHLEVSALETYSETYAKSKEAVIKSKKAEDESFDENTLGFAALDISIVDDETGEKIEPTEGAEVKVSFKMKRLPEDMTEEDFAGTLEIQHLNERTGITEVETVAQAQDVTVADGTAEAEFTIDSFSTFTITWSSNTTNTTTNLRLRAQGNNGNQYNNTVGAVVFNYVTASGASITRPTTVVGNTDINVSYRTNNFSNHEVIISSANVARTYNDRTYEKAYIIDGGQQKDITRILFSRTGNNSWSTAYYNGDTLVTTASGNNVTGDWRIPVYLQYSGDAATNKVTLHFVDRDGNELSGFKYGDTALSDTATFTMAELFPNNGDTLDLTTAFTKEGYTFANSFINYHNGTASDGVVIGNMLRRNNNVMQYKTLPGSSATNGYTNLTDGKDIYLVFDPTTGSGGGGGQGGGGETPDLGEIGNSKSVESNGDGTYNVSLSVSGTAQHKTEDTDVNVIFVIDCSNSMTMQGRTRLADTKVAVKNMANQLLQNNTTANPDAIELALVAFNASAWTVPLGSSNWTSNYNTFANAVGTGNNSGITSASGTNWEEALQHAIAVDKGDGDLTFVIFFTDGDPTEYAGHRTVDSTYVNNYWPARDEARTLVNDGKVLYGIYAYGETTGTHYLEPLVSYAYNGSSSGYYYLASDTSAVNAALGEILDTINMQFAYANVEIDDGITGLSSTPLKGADTSSLTYKITYRDYTSTTAYTEKTITTTANADGYKLTVNSDGTVTIPAVTYHVLGRDENNNTIVETVTTSEVTIKGAAFTDNGDAGKSVDWDMHKSDNSVYMLEDGWTYTIDFDVWPSQAAYDLVAALNNGVIEWGEDFVYTNASGNTVTVPFDDYKSQVNAGTPYTLKTNTTCTVKYQQVKATTDSDGNTTYEYGEVKTVPVVADPEGKMGLDSTTMNVQKAWDDSINTRNRANYVDFYLKIDGKYYQKDGTESTEVPSDDDAYLIPVTETGKYSDGTTTYSAGDTAWINSVYIAPGVMTTEGGIEVLETGHYYTILEKSAHKYKKNSAGHPIVGSEDSYQTYSMDFTSQTVRPMVVDGELEYLVLVDADNPVPSGAKVYTIGSEQYFVATGSTAGLTATNHKTPEFDITKKISDSTGKIEAELNEEIFTYTVTVTLPEDATDTEKDGVGYWIYEPSTSTDAWTLPEYAADAASYAPYGYTADAKYYGESRKALSFSGNTATTTIQIHRTDVIRFVNLPVGSTYTIVETSSDYYSIGASTTSSATGTSVSGATINGVTSEVNTRYYNQYTNTVTKDFVYGQLDVKKVLEGFDWLEDDEYTFTLTPVGTAPMPLVKGEDGLYNEASSVIVKATYDSDTQGSSVETFGKIRYTAAGTYQYTITETEGDLDYIDYAGPVTVTVTVEEVSGSLTVTNIEDNNGTTVYTAASSSAVANGLTSVTNKVIPTSVSATKEWLDAQGDVLTTIPEGAKVTFTLYQNGTATDQTVELDGTVDENGEAVAWEATFSDLPKYTVTVTDGVRTAIEITYTIGETVGYEGFKLITTDPVANGGKIQNQQQAIAVNMIKIDDAGGKKPLADAEFKLYSNEALTVQVTTDANGQPIGTNGTIKTNSEGKANIGTLSVGTYYLVETKAPDGYNKLTSAVKIYVSAIDTAPYIKVRYLQDDYSASQTTGLITNYDEDGTTIIGYTITVDNKSGSELPHTGGSGTLPYTLGGLAVMLTALMYGFRMRRRERRLN